MGTLNGIAFTEEKGSAFTQYDADSGWRGTRVFQIAWSDQRAFAEALLGFSTPVGGFGIRIRGQQYPGFNFLYCRSLSITGKGVLDRDVAPEIAAYDRAVVTAGYRPHNYTTSTTDEEEETDEEAEANLARFIEEWDFSGEFLTIPSLGFTWLDDGSAVDQNVGITLGTIGLTLTGTEEPLMNRALIASALGKVNSVTWYGFGAGKMRFDGAAARRTTTAEGIGAWEITYRFRARTKEWNKFWKPTDIPGAGGWVEIRDDGGFTVYGEFNFYNLFPGAPTP